MPFKRTLLMIAIASLTSACAVGPDYQRPATPLPERYLGQAALEQGRAGVAAELPVWWDGFGDPQLSHLVERALAQNLDLAQASARLAQARAGIGAANAAMLPAGAVQAQAARAYQSVETPLGQVLNAQPSFDRYGNAFEAGVGVGWELDLFGGLRRGREAALADYQAAAAGETAARLAVAAQTADLYITIRGLQSRLEVARKQVDTQAQLLATVNLLYGKGLAAELQVRQAEGALAQVRASVPVLDTALDTAMNALDVMLGTAPGTQRGVFAEAAAIPAVPAIAGAGAPGELLRRRPDLIVAERHLAASNARIGEAVAEYYPKLSLSGLLGSATSVSAGHLFSGGASQASGALGLRWRLFDFGRIDAQIGVAKGRQAEALAAYRLAVLRAAEDVENALSALAKREEQAVILSQGVEALTRARGASFAAYQKGVVSLVEVLQADENLLRATDTRVQAQAESARAAVAAFKALGGGWDAGRAETVALR